MKSAFFIIVALCFVASCLAACNCDAGDIACSSKCVTEANRCVSSCKDNTDCYQACISDHWPSASAAALPRFKAVLATASGDGNAVATASESVAVESASASDAAPKASASAGQKDISSTGQVSLALSLHKSAIIPASLIIIPLIFIAF